MGIRRFFRHLLTFRSSLARAFDPETRQAIEDAITASERTHRGELRFAVEARLGTSDLLAGKTARERSLDLFADLGVWDTEDNSGILIYVLLADHHVAVVADRGYRDGVTHAEWEELCSGMEAAFRAGDFRRGAVEGVLAAAHYAAAFFPLEGANPDELPDAVVFL